MRGVNKVILIGNLGSDPEVRYMPSGSAVASMSLATKDTWRDKQTGEMKEKTEWHRIEMFNRLGEIAGEYLKKGSKIYIEGSLRTDKWQGKDGQDRWTTKIVAREMQMLDSRGGGTASYDQSGGGQQAAPPSAPQVSQAHQSHSPPPQGARNASNQGPPPANDFDDDIPF